MFNVTLAESLEPLADRLAGLLRVPLADPFRPEIVAVPSAGVRSWLTGRLSRSLGANAGTDDGIAANIEFVYPATLVARALGTGREATPWDVDRLTWAIVERTADTSLLGRALDPLAARRVADRFDRYLLYRPTMVAAWEGGRDEAATGGELPGDQRWQAVLWRACVEALGPPLAPRRPATRTGGLRALLAAADLPERVTLFGVASLPAPWLQVLVALGQTPSHHTGAPREVHVLSPTPSLALWPEVSAAWGPPGRDYLPRTDDPTAGAAHHPLLASWGRAGREALGLLANHDVSPVLLPSGSTPRVDERNPTLLARLQTAIRANEPVDERAATGLAPTDRSFQIHECFGRTRQVEVLRDAIAHLLAADPTLEPRDVLVLTPDIGVFAPLVEATFTAGTPQLPVRVADRSLRQVNPMLAATQALLDLVPGRNRASDVLAFAALEPVRRRFGLDDDRLSRCSEWVDELGIRWGLDADDRERNGLTGIVDNTWSDGLDRLLVGVAAADRGTRLSLGTAPYGDVEGDDVVSAGILAELVATLRDAERDLRADRPLGAWCTAIARAADALFEAPDDQPWQRRGLDTALDALAADAVVGDRPSTVPIPVRDMAEVLRARLHAPAASARPGSGAITVSSLTAMRGVPARVVCLLGLDHDLLPAPAVERDDLLAVNACVGDRDGRQELRAQLLDTVLAARDHLVVLRDGRDVNTSREVPPAVVLAELLDIVDKMLPSGGTHPGRAAVTLAHPRHAYAAANFTPAAPWSFDARLLAIAADRRPASGRPPYLVDAPLPLEPVTEIRVDDLLDMLKHPTRFFLRETLGISIPDELEIVENEIPLTVDGLGQWRLDDECLPLLLADDDRRALDAWRDAIAVSGRVPPRRLGSAIIDRAVTRGSAIATRAEEVLGVGSLVGQPLAVDVECPDCGVRVVGTLPRTLLGGDGHATLFEVKVSKIKDEDRLRLWASLVLAAVERPEHPWRAVLVGRSSRTERSKRDTAEVVELPMADTASAKDALHGLVDLFQRARRSPIPLHPKTTWHAAAGASESAVRNAWNNMVGFGDGDDRYRRFVFGEIGFDEMRAEPCAADERDEGWARGRNRFDAYVHYVQRVWEPALTPDTPREAKPTKQRAGRRSTAGDRDG